MPGVARRENRQRPEPVRREDHHGLDVLALDQGLKAGDRGGVEFVDDRACPKPHRLADRANLESVGQRAQRRSVPLLPGITQADQSDAYSHPTTFLAASSASDPAGGDSVVDP